MVFEGIKVLDFTWVAVGPLTIKYLADHGATVVHVESASRPCPLRPNAPFKDMVPGVNRSQFAANYNTSKYSLGLNMSKPQAQELVRRVITTWQPDIIAESFTPKAMRGWGLDYESVKQLKPDIIYFSTCQQGQTGPHALYPGYGNLMAALAGVYYLTGWPDRGVSPPYGAYTDFINPKFNVPLLIAALDYKRRTGRGQYIDMSQFEVAAQFWAPAVLDYLANGRVMERRGNRDDLACPHGAYPCRGDDRWCVIAVASDAQWQAFCDVLGDVGWSGDPRFATFLGRKAHEDELDRLVAEWTRDYHAEQVMTMLQAAGVPAGVVQSSADLWQDPQVRHRGFFQWLEHSECGPMPYDGLSFTMSRTPGSLRMPHACVGEHNEFILKEMFGLSDDEVADLVAAEVLEST